MYLHQPVLLREVIEYLAIKPDGIYVDATFGRGGHSREILHQLGLQGRLIAIDKDPDAVAAAQETFKDERFFIQQGTFTMLKNLLDQQHIFGKVNGILFDLGVSSPQLENPLRGFSFLHEGPLDMRMNPTSGISAAEWLHQAEQDEIANVLKEYGEERFARRIANAIVTARQQQPINTTTQLADIVARANPKWEKHKHPATRSFLAIRVFINQELIELSSALEQALNALTIGGRLLTISFHSLEDRLVKQFFQKHAKGEQFPRHLPIKNTEFKAKLKILSRAIKPNETEIKNNPRARSAILRIAEKIA